MGFLFENERLVGGRYRQARTSNNTTRTLYDIKRIIGKNYDDPILQSDLRNYALKSRPINKTAMIEIEIGDQIKKFLRE